MRHSCPGDAGEAIGLLKEQVLRKARGPRFGLLREDGGRVGEVNLRAATAKEAPRGSRGAFVVFQRSSLSPRLVAVVSALGYQAVAVDFHELSDDGKPRKRIDLSFQASCEREVAGAVAGRAVFLPGLERFLPGRRDPVFFIGGSRASLMDMARLLLEPLAREFPRQRRVRERPRRPSTLGADG